MHVTEVLLCILVNATIKHNNNYRSNSDLQISMIHSVCIGL